MTDSTRKISTPFRFLASTFALIATAALPGCGTELKATIAEVDGQAVEIVETGTGKATVVFEAGFGNDWTPWDQVACEVAPKARVFAYSRPGYGDSAPSTDPRDAAHIVKDLRSLLSARHYSPPYVLVGHSFGGTYMELFAKAHPDEVSALVLVEPRHRNFTVACQHAGIEGCTIPSSTVASLPPVEIAEYEAFERTSAQIDAAGSFGKYPVRVLTATSHGFVPAAENLWVTMLGSLAKEGENGRQIVFTGAGHNLATERAHEVAEVILSVLPPK